VALSKAAGKAYVHNKLPFDSFELVDKGRAIQFDIEKESWTCSLRTYECTKKEKPKENGQDELLSPDSRWTAFVKDHNLYVRSTETKEEEQLTDDGKPYYDYASHPESRTRAVTDRLFGRKLPPVAIWSPDSKKLVTHRLDQRKVLELHLIQSVPPKGVHPVLHSYRYPIAGDENVPLAELVILNLEQKKMVKVDSEPLLTLFLTPITLRLVWWSKDSEKIYFVQEERGMKALKLWAVDVRTGTTQMITEERGSTHVELNLLLATQPNVRILGGGSEIIWFSQRDGWAHLYLLDGKTGKLKNQITSGTWVVRDIKNVDESNRWVYFTAGGREKGRDPYFRHLYRIKLNGSGQQLLTPEDADHTVTFSPSGRYFVDTYLRIDMVPVSVIRSSDGKLIRKLEEADIELLLATGWKFPERFSVKARDGITDIYGAIYRPINFDPEKKYPVIDSIYPGPQTIRTPKSFSSYFYGGTQSLAELGFIVVTIDGMGTPLRSKTFHNVSYGKLEEGGGLEDHIVGLKQLASRYPYMDLNRVGIHGHSGGGFASTRAILLYPDFYKVAVSAAGNHDQRLNIAIWGEKYQGLPEGDNYAKQVNASLAKNLKGKLLLAHGELDDNVHPAMTMQMVDALIKANKDFDMLILPNANHGFGAAMLYFTRKKWDYFVKHLLGMEPPKGYKIRVPGGLR